VHREEGRGEWLAATIVCLLPGTAQVSKFQSLTNGSLVVAAWDLRRKARAGTAEGQNPLSEQPSGRKSFHRKNKPMAKPRLNLHDLTYEQKLTQTNEIKTSMTGNANFPTPTPPAVPGQVLSLVLTTGDYPGTLDVAFDSAAGAKSYEVQTGPDPMSEASWVFKQSVTRSSGTIPGLISGSKVWVRVGAVGAAGAGSYSDPATKVVP
jgi:hypothetical protein